MPNIITASSISVLFYNMFSTQGPVTTFLKNTGIIAEDFNFMLDPGATVGIIGFMQFWMWYGNTMIVLIAGILGINPSLYEAAMVDGASSRQQFFSITMPLLKPIFEFTLVTSAIGGLQMFDIPSLYNVAQGIGQPNRISHTVTMNIKEYAFSQNPDYGKAAALSIVLFIFTLIISSTFFVLTRDKEPKQQHAVIK
jgi:multiple sugar transport system permease protein